MCRPAAVQCPYHHHLPDMVAEVMNKFGQMTGFSQRGFPGFSEPCEGALKEGGLRIMDRQPVWLPSSSNRRRGRGPMGAAPTALHSTSSGEETPDPIPDPEAELAVAGLPPHSRNPRRGRSNGSIRGTKIRKNEANFARARQKRCNQRCSRW